MLRQLLHPHAKHHQLRVKLFNTGILGVGKANRLVTFSSNKRWLQVLSWHVFLRKFSKLKRRLRKQAASISFTVLQHGNLPVPSLQPAAGSIQTHPQFLT